MITLQISISLPTKYQI